MWFALPFGTSTRQIEWNFAIARCHWIPLVIRALHRDRLDAPEYGKKDSHEAARNEGEGGMKTRRKSKTLSLWSGARAQVRPTFPLQIGSRGAASARPFARSVGGRKRSRWGERGGREARKRDRQVGPREEPAAAMVTVAFPPRLVAMETTASPGPSRSPLTALSALSLSLLCSHDKPARSHSRNSVFLALEAPIFSPTTTGGSLSRPRSVLPSRRIPERGRSKKRETDEGDSPRTCTHARYLVLRDIRAQCLFGTVWSLIKSKSLTQPRNALLHDTYLWHSRGSWCLSKRIDTMSSLAKTRSTEDRASVIIERRNGSIMPKNFFCNFLFHSLSF